METKPRWGITLPLPNIALAGQREIVAGLPGLGYTDAWSAEVNGTDAFAPLAAAAQWSSELRLGTAIAPIFTRGPGLLAMSGATLASLAPGRFVLGIGTSTPIVVQQWNAVEFARPYQRARDMLRFLRPALVYASRLAWPVFPLKPHGKDPLTAHGYKDATVDEKQIREWAKKWPDANIGIPTGIRFWVLDIDPRNGGD